MTNTQQTVYNYGAKQDLQEYTAEAIGKDFEYIENIARSVSSRSEEDTDIFAASLPQVEDCIEVIRTLLALAEEKMTVYYEVTEKFKKDEEDRKSAERESQ